jgi:hypothetical protein
VSEFDEIEVPGTTVDGVPVMSIGSILGSLLSLAETGAVSSDDPLWVELHGERRPLLFISGASADGRSVIVAHVGEPAELHPGEFQAHIEARAHHAARLAEDAAS